MDIKSFNLGSWRPPDGKSGIYILNERTKAITLSGLTSEHFSELLGITGGLEQLAANVAYLYAAYDARAGEISKLPVVLKNNKGEVVSKWPVQVDLPDLLYRSELSLNIHGEAYMFKEQINKRKARLRWFDPASVEPLVDEKRGLYAFRRNLAQGGREYPVEPQTNLSEMLWIWLRGLRETSPGVSPSQVVRFASEMLRNIDLQSSQFFEGGAMPVTLLEVPDTMSPEDAKRVESGLRRYINKIAPRENKPVRAINRSIKVHQLSFNPKDLQVGELEESKRKDIEVASRVPDYILTGKSENVATAENTRQQWMESVILPRAELVIGEMNRQLFKPLGYELVIARERISIFQKQELQKAQALTELAGGAIFTVNEVREMAGAEPLPYGDFIHDVNQPIVAESSTEEISQQPPPSESDSQSAKAAELTRLRRWAKKRKNPRAAGVRSDILTPAEIREEIRNIKSPRFIPDGNPLPPVPADFSVTERDIENAIEQWDDTFPELAGLLDADATATESEGQ